LLRCFVRRNQMLEIHLRFIDLSLSSTAINLLLQKNWFLILLFFRVYIISNNVCPRALFRLEFCTANKH
jgi:hypothetical protein